MDQNACMVGPNRAKWLSQGSVMKYLSRKNAILFFLSVEVGLILLAVPFQVPAHLLEPYFIGVAILAIPFTIIIPSQRSKGSK